MTQFFLIRHGEPDWELKENRGLQGALRDFVPLTQKGIHQAESLADEERLNDIDAIVTSPYTRSLQTAAILSRRLQVSLQVEFDLHEWTPDRFQAQSLSELDELFRDYNVHDGVPEEGVRPLWETKESVQRRCLTVLKRYQHYHRVAVVAHGMVIRILRNLPGDHQVDHASLHELDL